MNKSFQEKYAKYYDLIYKDKEYEKECDFLEEIFKKNSKNNPKTILDVACGTGGHAIPLAKRGYKVTGIDYSEKMIEIAREKARKYNVNLDFHIMSMREFELNKKFDAIICMFSAIDYLTNYEELKEALNNIKLHMNKDSLFIFDFWNGFAVLNSYSPLRIKISEDNDRKMIRISDTKVNAIKHICEVIFNCIMIEKNVIIDQFEEKHIVRFFFPEEIKYILDENGFEVLRMCPFLNLDDEIDENEWNISVISKIK